MDYTEFKDFVKSKIKSKLPDSYAACSVEILEVVKNNNLTLDGLLIKSKESNAAPNIYLNRYFRDYEQGVAIEKILDTIADIRIKMDLLKNFDLSSVTDFDKAKDHIVCRLVNAEKNQGILTEMPFTRIEDLAVTYHVVVGNDESGTSSVSINHTIMEMYDVSVERLHEIALINMERLTPSQFISMHDAISKIMVEDIMHNNGISKEEALEEIESMLPPEDETMYCLSNTSKLYGAAAILVKANLERIAEQIGGNFYVIPSSVHEVLIIPQNVGYSRMELELIVREVNETQVSLEDQLSDHMYEYDAKECELMRSDRAEQKRSLSEKNKDISNDKKKSLVEALGEKKIEAAVVNRPKDRGRIAPEPELG